jgi:hypothetical protein
MKPRVAIITTLQHNVGDDFVREGIIYLLGRVIPKMELALIHKHLPITVRSEFGWLHSSRIDHRLDRLGDDFALKLTRRIDARLPVFPGTDRIARSDVLVQSGGPVYWLGAEGSCAKTEWWDPLIERRWIPNSRGRIFLNLAGGTCQRYDSDGSEFAERTDVLAHIRRYYDLTALTTVRDELSLKVLHLAGREGLLLPCTSIFAVDRLGIAPASGEFIVLNYMPAGGHFMLGQKIEAAAWERRFVALARRLAARGRVVLVCHNEKEMAAAKTLLPGMETFYSDDYRAYLRLYARARWGIMNRVHGAFALASLGKPAAVVGSDSRARMAGMLGLPEVFVNEATDEWLDGVVSQLEEMVETFPLRMTMLKANTAENYVAHLRTALERAGKPREEEALLARP